MTYLDLNPMQRKAAETFEGPLLILAGAGSGKTRTITARIANLLSAGVPGYAILALTFTNKAAREMRERVEKLTGGSAGEMWIGTFHSICVRILRRDIDKLGYQRSFTIYDEEDSLKVIKDTLKALNMDEKILPPKDVKRVISDAKNRVLSPDEWFSQSDRDYRAQRLHDVFITYEKRLAENNALDFDDLIVKTLQLFVDHPPVLSYYQNRFRYVHVDEYQDTNRAQYQLVRLLTTVSRNLCVVGDDDQSIYGWRGADIHNILDFEKDYPDTTVIKLEQNYRSTSNILDAANQVIAHNRSRKEKALWTDAGEGEPIIFCSAGDEKEEGAWICEQIRHLKEMNVSYSEIAVLYRVHAQSRVIEEMLMRSAIPYRVFGGTRFYDHKEIKDAIAYLRVLLNHADDISLERIINTPRRSIGDSTVELLRAHAAETEISLYDTLAEPPETLSSRPRKCVKDFSDLLSSLEKERSGMKLSEFVNHVLTKTGLLEQYSNESSEENQTRRQNLMEFVGAAQEFENRSEDSSLEAFLENVSLVSDLDRQEDAPKYVTLMTVHTAKGLEYKAVFIAGLEDGIFPMLRNLNDPKRLEEERRLCYVGITRAKERLFLSCAKRRMLYNQIMHNDRSVFLREIPPRLLHDEWNRTDSRKTLSAATPAWHKPEPPRPDFPKVRKTNLSFGTPGMNQRQPLQIPGVTKGFVPSKARDSEAGALKNLFKPGDTVLHRKFGQGKVLEVFGKGADARIRISFTAYGEKVFSLSIVPIVKVESR